VHSGWGGRPGIFPADRHFTLDCSADEEKQRFPACRVIFPGIRPPRAARSPCPVTECLAHGLCSLASCIVFWLKGGIGAASSMRAGFFKNMSNAKSTWHQSCGEPRCPSPPGDGIKSKK
jgi:hypothetical protein